MEGLTIRAARVEDREQLVEMRYELWPESTREEQEREVDAEFAGEASGGLPKVILVSVKDSGGLIGFLEAGLRSHADGCDTALPVGYVEGWFVREPWRGRGVGAELMRAAEEWAREQGCREMASDALVDNVGSQNAHEALGFEVVDRCVHYRKRL
jgi:aminoglycoside 6'-N-acetyltransferase I